MGLRDNPLIVLTIAVLIFCAAALLSWMFARLWRGEPRVMARFIESALVFTGGEEKRRAIVRGAGGICLALWGVSVAMIGVSMDSLGFADRGAGSRLFWFFVGSGIVLLFLGIVLERTIILWGRPRFLIPPSLRVEKK